MWQDFRQDSRRKRLPEHSGSLVIPGKMQRGKPLLYVVRRVVSAGVECYSPTVSLWQFCGGA